MATANAHPHLYKSPKRKRGTTDSIQYSPVVSPSLTRIATDQKEYPFLRTGASGEPLDRTGDGSPRTNVAVQLNGLDLRQESQSHTGHTSKRLAYLGNEDNAGQPNYPLPRGHVGSAVHECVSEPQMPHLQEMSPMDISVHANAAFTFEATEAPSMIVERPRMHNRSPPPDGDPEDNPMTWHESEITGYDPTDPTDDGYGLNGIGFKPTAAMAWARSQKRKQQLAEYNSREAKEARQRRSERRRLEEGSTESSPGKGKKKAASVRFENA